MKTSDNLNLRAATVLMYWRVGLRSAVFGDDLSMRGKRLVLLRAMYCPRAM